MSGTEQSGAMFVPWLLEEIESRGWTREEFARRADMNSSVITNIVSGNKAVGTDTAKRVAKALGYAQRTVFIIAGLLDDEDAEDAKEEGSIQQLKQLLADCTPDQRKRYLTIFRAILEADNRRPSDAPATRPSSRPVRSEGTG